ncbi:MAG: hypothetical protein H7123_08060 [Thermoleophilia bacterium]|nr:hypothetical protein [Thermoleophilia bacterium]
MPLSVQLFLLGVLAACTPFLVALLTVVVLPRSTVERMAGPDIDRDLAIANASMSSERAEVRASLAGVSDTAIQQAVATGDTSAIAQALPDRLARRVPITITKRSEVVTRAAFATVTTPTLGIASVVVGDKIVSLDQLLDTSLLSRAHPAGPTLLAVIIDDTVRTGSRGTPLAAGTRLKPSAGRDIGPIAQHDGSGRWLALTDRAGAHDPMLVGFRSGNNATLVMQARGSDLTMVLLLLLGSGISTAICIVVLIGRRLNAVADSASRMAGGDLTTRLPVVGADAGARLSASLNRMGRDLEARISELEVLVDRSSRVLATTEDGVCLWGASGTLEVWNAAASRIAAAGSHGDARENTLTAVAATATAVALRAESALGARRILLPVCDGTSSVAVDLVVTQAGDGGLLQVFRDAGRTISIEQARENFLVTAAHELRTPLVPLLGFLPMLQASGSESSDIHLDPATARLALEQSTNAAHRLADVVDALVDGSMLAREQITVQPEPHYVVDIIDAALDRCEITRDDLIVTVPADMTALCDVRAVQRAVAELIDNAVKYGDDSPAVVRARELDDSVQLDVINSGIHVPIHAREQVFEPFFRLDPDMRQGVGGVGLGLFVARRLIEATGGRLEMIESDDDTTAFRVILPTATAEVSVTPAVRAGLASGRSAQS